MSPKPIKIGEIPVNSDNLRFALNPEAVRKFLDGQIATRYRFHGAMSGFNVEMKS